MKHYLHTPILGKLARNTFEKICDNIQGDYDAVFAHSTSTDQMSPIEYQEKTIIIYIDDNVEFTPHYNWWTKNPEPQDFPYLRQVALNNPNATCVFILQGNHYTAEHFKPLTNVRVVKSFETPETEKYFQTKGVVKNFDSQAIGICLNRQMRVHRMSLISLLYGLDLDQYCYISAFHLHKQLDKLPSDQILDHNDWFFDPQHEDFKAVLQKGFGTIVDLYRTGKKFQREQEDIYVTMPDTDFLLAADNSINFERELRGLYTNSFVEFVANKLYSEPGTSLDEKLWNSVFGRNFPIFIGTPGSVDMAREFGLDMFDDVVDHRYDLIENPIDRLEYAVTRNQHLLTDHEKTKRLWQDCEERFNKNIDHLGKNLYNWLEYLTLSSCNKEIPDLLKEKFNVTI